MSGISPTICGLVQVTWNQDNTVNAITYNGLPLNQVITPLVNLQLLGNRVILNNVLVQIIRDLLNTISAIPQIDRTRKIHLADMIFNYTINIRLNIPNPKIEVL